MNKKKIFFVMSVMVFFCSCGSYSDMVQNRGEFHDAYHCITCDKKDSVVLRPDFATSIAPQNLVKRTSVTDKEILVNYAGENSIASIVLLLLSLPR